MCIFLTFCDRLLNCYCWTILNKSSNGLPQWPLPTCPGSDIQKLQQYSDSQTILDHSIYLIIERHDNTGGESGTRWHRAAIQRALTGVFNPDELVACSVCSDMQTVVWGPVLVFAV